jgi:membrane-associated protein
MMPELAGYSAPVIYLIVFAVLFVESGVLVGVFLPGDSLLFGAGLLAGSDRFGVSVWVLVAIVWLAAVAGDTAGYGLGRRYGRRYLLRALSRRGEKLVDFAEQLYRRHGWFAIVVARWFPGVRAIVPALAGIGSMRYLSFFTANAVGGLVWAGGLVVLGYLAFAVPAVHELALLAMTISIAVTVGYATFHSVRRLRRRSQPPAEGASEVVSR